VYVNVFVRIRVIETSELSVEDRMAPSVALSNIGDVRCTLFDRRVIGEIERI